uniref:Putative secreted protein n=1 Tax=Amblyomma triste TaxID=251400 RepID=A0A023G325_AMBTT
MSVLFQATVTKSIVIAKVSLTFNLAAEIMPGIRFVEVSFFLCLRVRCRSKSLALLLTCFLSVFRQNVNDLFFCEKGAG